MKKQFLVFRKGGENKTPKAENELSEGGAGNAETSGANEQANASRGDVAPDSNKLASGDPKPDWYDKNKGEQQTEGPDPKK